MSDPKLAELTNDRQFRHKVAQVLVQLEARGESPRIYETKRTLAEQIEKVRKGYSKTIKSFHLKRGSDGGARAADIADAVTGWNARKRFWLIMAAASHSYGIGWGGCFGLNSSQKRAVLVAIDELREVGWPHDHPSYEVRIGWDPAHLQDSPTW
jgi:hypothetical protein